MNSDERITRVLIAICVLLLIPWTAFGYQKYGVQGDVKKNGCGECHVCRTPTVEDPCLRDCPRPRTTAQEISHVPDEILVNEIEYEYEGVRFSHKLHAEMTAIDKGCQSCHHFQETGGITSCKQCHAPEIADENLDQPGLKGAYHRQCLGCHQEWSHDTQCNICHEKKLEPGPPVAGHYPPKQYKPFGDLQEPVKKVWQSTYDGGSVVTLFHKNHTDKYGIDCASCHHAEGCGSCHGRKESTTAVRHSEEALHAICNQCHQEMSCDQCHLKQEATEFNHDRTGWPLGEHHSRLSCRRCHGDPHHFTKPVTACNICHRDWALGTFDHKRTGFVLSENHVEIDCNVCHANKNYAAAPACTECHDADIAFPAALPGEYLR